MTKIWLPSSKWKAKGQAKHFVSAKLKKAARLEKAWTAKSKSK